MPIRVELKALTRDDFRRILTEPEASLIKQYVALMATESVAIEFTEDGIDAIAAIAAEVNATVENIGARRLQTIMERVLDEMSFTATDRPNDTVRIDGAYVRSRVEDLAKDQDLSRFILGGKIAVWADGSTRFAGEISARGGAEAGNGGYAEVSGKYLEFKGTADTQAPHGETGTLLLDPADIVIANGTGDGAADGNNTFMGVATAGTVAGGDAGPTTIYESELQGIAATTNISITTTNSITINNLTTDGNLNLAQNGGRTVTFSTGPGGFVMLNTANTITTNGGALNITSTGVTTLGNLATNGGAINITSTGVTLTLGGGYRSAASSAGIVSGVGTALTKTGAGTLTLAGTNTYTGGTTITVARSGRQQQRVRHRSNLSERRHAARRWHGPDFRQRLDVCEQQHDRGHLGSNLNGTLTLTGNRTLTVSNTGLTTLGRRGAFQQRDESYADDRWSRRRHYRRYCQQWRHSDGQ